jgi:hypothetical protein
VEITPATLKSRATILSASNQVKIAPSLCKALIWLNLFALAQNDIDEIAALQHLAWRQHPLCSGRVAARNRTML